MEENQKRKAKGQP